ncbi:unnamed protein product [Chrysoparadoxa australica]
MRGDDELLELLGEMASNNNLDEDSSDESRGSSGKPSGVKRDWSGRPVKAATERTEPNKSLIWNPHARADIDLEWTALRKGSGLSRGSSPQAELTRHQAISSIKARFKALCIEIGQQLPSKHLENWIFAQKLKEGAGGDPLVPLVSASSVDASLLKELCSRGVKKGDARNVCRELNRAAISASKAMRKQLRSHTHAGKVVVKRDALGQDKSGDVGGHCHGDDLSPLLVTCGGHSLRINSAHYHKLRQLYGEYSGNGSADTPGFHSALFSLLMRYESLQGGGFQAAVMGSTFDVLRDQLGVALECFASPLNCRYSRYCSAFLDTDAAFGSIGSFFNFHPTHGSFQANPPFVHEVILRMAEHIDALLCEATGPMLFVVIIPSWDHLSSWQALHQSKFMLHHIKLNQADHGYCEGKQQLRRSRFKVASFDTSLFYMANAAGEALWPWSEKVETSITQSFVSKQKDEVEQGSERKVTKKLPRKDGEGRKVKAVSGGIDAKGVPGHHAPSYIQGGHQGARAQKKQKRRRTSC